MISMFLLLANLVYAQQAPITPLSTTSGIVVLLDTEVGVDSDHIISDIKKASKPVYLLIDSPGGSILDGARIINAIQNSIQPVYTICIGWCASMAAIILEYGSQRYAIDRSIIMFHPASIGGMKGEELEKAASELVFMSAYYQKMNKQIAKRCRIDYLLFQVMLHREIWLDAEDAYKRNFIDAVVKLD